MYEQEAEDHKHHWLQLHLKEVDRKMITIGYIIGNQLYWVNRQPSRLKNQILVKLLVYRYTIHI